MTAKPTIRLEKDTHRGTEVVKLCFDYNADLISVVKRLAGTHWSSDMRCWYIAKQEFNLNVVFRALQPLCFIDYSALRKTDTEEASIPEKFKAGKVKLDLTDEARNRIEAFKRWMLQMRYSNNTISNYVHQLEIFFGYYSEKALDVITNNDINHFNQELILKYGLSFTFQNQTISALKKYYKFQLNSVLVVDEIERPRKGFPLPKVMSKQEVKMLFDSIGNIKHRMAFETIYACGLRRGELLNLKLEHINRHTGLISILNAKGKKDRVIPISKRWLDKLIPYYREKKPLTYIIEGQTRGKAISATSLQKIFERQLKKCGIKRHYTIHSLRHSIATHMLEAGVNLRYIQEFLGHKSSKTTEIYTHVSSESLKNMINPFDDL